MLDANFPSTPRAGWLAEDELLFFVQQIQWVTLAFAFFTQVVTWNRDTADIDETSYSEISIPNNRLTIMPVLAGGHWAAIEINRVSHVVTVQAVGFPQPFLPRVAAAVARLMDLTPDMLQCTCIALPDLPHMCGWQLLRRWITLSGMDDMLPPTDDGFSTLPIDRQQLIDEVVTNAIEDWIRAGIGLDDWLIPSKLRRAFFVYLALRAGQNLSVTDFRLFVHFMDSDVPAPVRSSPLSIIHPAMPEFHVLGRLVHLRDHASWLASDELDFLLELPRRVCLQEVFCPPCFWDEQSARLLYFGSLRPDFRFHAKVSWMCIVSSTWIQIDMTKIDRQPASFFVSAPPEVFPTATRVVHALAGSLGLDLSAIQVIYVPFVTAPHFCGWALIHGLYIRKGLMLPDTTVPTLAILRASRHFDVLQEINRLAIEAWEETDVSTDLSDFAYDVRQAFLVQVLQGRCTHSVGAAGGPGDNAKALTTAEPSDASADPWLLKDPWSSTKPKKLFSTKWEDLVLPTNHPFLGADGAVLPQTHRLQAVSRRNGIILATKGAIADIIRSNPTGPTAVILPNADVNGFGDVAKKITGPFEIVLYDPALKAEYKRLILMLTLHDGVTFQLPKPKVTLTTAEVIELVLEIDSRLLAVHELESVKAAPIEFMKAIVFRMHPDLKDVLSFYALRVGRHATSSKSDQQWQCIVKAPSAKRKILLQSSGMSCILFRPFFDKSPSVQDHSVVPKFWPPTAKDLAELRIVIKENDGFAGVVLTRRGLACRAWDSGIASVRTAVLPGDARLTKENLAIVPKFTYNATGWPPAIDPQAVVSSTLQAVGLAPIPTKAFRAGGVHGWVLAFGSKPSVQRFSLEINKGTFEILLVEEELTPFAKPFGKPPNHVKKAKRQDESNARPGTTANTDAGRNPSFTPSSQIGLEAQRSVESQRLIASTRWNPDRTGWKRKSTIGSPISNRHSDNSCKLPAAPTHVSQLERRLQARFLAKQIICDGG